ncbi:hypothetical protein CDAR_76591 [Caerostris darwini]|uniref:Uncharacterized protein n=1 Tax=Caerostris darwini TaxID=1538125 RepID=A0AAV4QEW3_9ARAC|nr:hypothetical protein CDAR_76591 [Caerostris darwini]
MEALTRFERRFSDSQWVADLQAEYFYSRVGGNGSSRLFQCLVLRCHLQTELSSPLVFPQVPDGGIFPVFAPSFPTASGAFFLEKQEWGGKNAIAD